MSEPDVGLFGPRSVTWHLFGDPMMWIAGFRALYLQALHPVAVRGVVQNSDFRHNPIGRLRNTAAFVSGRTYGTTEQALALGARVKRVHDALRIRDPETGEVTHRIDEPDLLLWIHCAEIASYVDVVHRAGYPLTDAQRDAYVAEQRRSAELVGLDPSTVPATYDELTEYFEKVRPELRRSEEADNTYDFMQLPPTPRGARWAVGLIWRPVTRLAYSTLPDWAIELYGERAYDAATTTRRLRRLRRVALLIPGRLRWIWPAPRYLVKAIGRLGRATAWPSPRKIRSTA